MPGDIAFDSGTSYWGTNLTIAVLNGTVPEWRLDDMCTRIMAAYYYVGRDVNYVPTNFFAVSRLSPLIAPLTETSGRLIPMLRSITLSIPLLG